MQIKAKKSNFYQAFAAIALMGSVSFGGISASTAQETMLRTLRVTGEGVELIPTTLTQVRLGVQIEGKTAQEVQQQVAQRANNLVTLLQELGVSNLETTGINLQPTYDYSNNQQLLVGYIASNTVSFEVDTAQAGPIIDQAITAGATRIDGVGFLASDDAIAIAKKEALTAATIDAQNQANQVLSALNLEAEEIITIEINGVNAEGMPYRQNVRSLASEAADFQTIVVGGEQTVRASVTLHIRY